MLKKTFLAVSVGAALGSAGAFAAPAFDYQQSLWTNQAAEDVTAFAVPDVTVTMGTEYTEDDTITFTWSAPVTGTYAPSVSATPASAFNFSSLVLGLIDSTANSATYRVTSLVAAQVAAAGDCGTVPIGDDCPIVTTGASFTLTNGGTAATDDLRTANNGDGAGLTGTYAAVTQNGDALDGTATPVPLLDAQADGSATAAARLNDTTNLFSFVNQYAVNSSPLTGTQAAPFDGVIDVDPTTATDRREVFVANAALDTNATSDVLVIDFLENNIAGHTALTSNIATTITGDFSWIQDTNAQTPGVQPGAGVVVVNPAPAANTLVVTADSISFAYDYAGTDNAADLSATLIGGITVTLDNAATNLSTAANATRPQLPDTTYTVSTVIEYQPIDASYVDSDTSTAAADGATYAVVGNEETTAGLASAGGAWTYNGSVVDIYAVPTSFARNTPFIWITNSNGVAGEVYGAATTESGVAVDLGELGTIGANEIKSFSTEVVSALTDAGITSGRVTLELTTSVPACGVNVSAQYYNLGDNDRAALETSQTIGGVYGTQKAAAISGGGNTAAGAQVAPVVDNRCTL